MIDVVSAGERLLVTVGPNRMYRLITWAWPLMVGLSMLACGYVTGALAAPGAAPAGTGAKVAAAALCFASSVIMLRLLHGFRTTRYRFDRRTGTLGILRTGPLSGSESREILLGAVTALLDRRSSGVRQLELGLADGSQLVLAREQMPGFPPLDAVAREVSLMLGKALELGSGVVIGRRFEVERRVGHGGMGVVYRAHDRASGAPVAIKLVLTPGDDPTRAERFAREIRVLAEIVHPRIAAHIASGTTDDGQPYLAMSWLEGEDLSRTLERGPLSLTDGLQVLAGAAEAMSAVHARGVVHRDLKPGNLFLRGGKASDVVLIDFGVARRLENTTRVTASAAIIGTPRYMAPEQASSAREISPAADVFSLGCIFYECLTGKSPFDAPQLAGVLARILFDNPEPVSALCPGVPEAWSQLLVRMLAKDPAARPRDGAELLAELARLPASGPESGVVSRERGARVLPALGESAHARAGGNGAFLDTQRDAPAEGADQVLVCVVLASVGTPLLAPDADAQRLDSIRSAMSRFGCPIERLIDGSLLATVLPQQSATDQVRIAARCAVYLRELMPEARIAVATGRASLRRGPRVGDAVDRAAQLLARVPEADGIRLDKLSAQLLDSRFVTLTQSSQPPAGAAPPGAAPADSVVLLVGQRPDLDASRPLLGKPTPCVGRELELMQLEGLVANAVEESAPKLGLVLGPPGIGKSRLRHELLRRLAERYPEQAVLVGYGDPLNAGSPYVLLSDALRRHAGIHVGVDPAESRVRIEQLCARVASAQRRRVSEFLGELCSVPFPDEQSPPLAAARTDHRVMSEQVSLAFQDFIAAECQDHPLLLVLEDLQWGDALTVKLIESVLRELKHGTLAVVAFARPQLEEVFPKLWAAERALSLALRPLSQKASEALVKGVLGEGIQSEPLERIVRLAAGNALFLEELMRAAAEGEAGEIPETVLAMLQARLSRLAPEARRALRAASVIGEVFWQNGVQALCEGAGIDAARWLGELCELEIVQRLRVSRFPGDAQFAFRHALVCDAAYGLLTLSDRRAGHLAAGRWLAGAGETDGIVLARHAEEAGDRESAMQHYLRAAEQSLERYDFAEALARAEKGEAAGASGRALGVLRSVQAAARYNMGHWTQAAERGLSALPLLGAGSALWCSNVEQLMQVLPNVARFDESEQLSLELFRTEPEPDARTPYLRAVYSQLLGHAVAGAYERGRACLEFIDGLSFSAADRGVVARGYAALWRGVFTFIVGDDATSSVALLEQAIGALATGQVLYRLSLAHSALSFAYWGLGRHAESIRVAREGRVIAVQIKDDYHTALADWYLGLALSEQPEPERWAEAAACARSTVALQASPVFEATSKSLSARIALARGDYALAESDGRFARTGLGAMVPFRLIASASLVTALTRQRRHAEAAAIAIEDLALLDNMAGPICSDVLFRVAAADALFESGGRAAAEGALRAALRKIELRSHKIPDPVLRQLYLSGRPENRRAFELARVWLAPEHAGSG